jgi:hypothetical protein
LKRVDPFPGTPAITELSFRNPDERHAGPTATGFEGLKKGRRGQRHILIDDIV